MTEIAIGAQKSRGKMLVVALRHTPLILFALIFLVFGLLSPRFLSYQSFENIVKQASYIGIVAVGMTFVLLTAGIDLSVGSNMYLSAVVAGLLIKHHGLPVTLALVVCLAVGLLFGIVNALVVTKLQDHPLRGDAGDALDRAGARVCGSRNRLWSSSRKA